MSSPRLALVGVLAIGLVALSGCHSDPAAIATSTPTRTPSVMPSPISTGLPAGTLLRVTATATATNGTQLDLVETASVPQPGDGSERAAADADGCDGYDDLAPVLAKNTWIHIQVVSSLRSGSAWDNDMGTLLAMGGNSQDREVWSGDIGGGQAECSFRVLRVPGSAAAVAPVDPDAAVGDRWSWTTASWGFAWEYEGETPQVLPFSFTSCTLELGPAAQGAASVLPRQSGYQGDIVPCAFGRAFGSS